jgi:hypothetical protein
VHHRASVGESEVDCTEMLCRARPGKHLLLFETRTTAHLLQADAGVVLGNVA